MSQKKPNKKDSKSLDKPKKQTPQPKTKPSKQPMEEQFTLSTNLRAYLNRSSEALSSTPTISSFQFNKKAQQKLDSTFQIPKNLESIVDAPKPKHSNTKMASQFGQKASFEKQKFENKPKKYNIDLSLGIGEREQAKQGKHPQMEIETDQNLVRPSVVYNLPEPRTGPHCIFQTPVLPCFPQTKLEPSNKDDPVASFFQTQYDSCGNKVTDNYKCLAKEGVYKIGKIKIKGKKAQLTIGDFKMEGSLGYGQGKAVSISGGNMYELGMWSGMWVVQPTQQTLIEM